METSLRHTIKPPDVTAVSQDKDPGFIVNILPKVNQCCLNLALPLDPTGQEYEYHCDNNSFDDLSSEMTSESITHNRKFGLIPKSKSGPNLGLLQDVEMSQLT